MYKSPTPHTLTLLLLLASTPACSHHKADTKFTTTFQSPPIARSTSIHNVADYLAATSTAQETYLSKLQAQTAMPAVWVTNQLATLPSATTKRYAQALATVLQQHAINGTQPPTTPGTKTITYEELAKVAALTSLLRGNPESYAIGMPEDLWLDLLDAVVRYCPCDDAALLQVASILYLWSSELPSGQVRLKWKTLIRAALARPLDPQRPMNFTTLPIALGGGGEFLILYLFTIDDPTGHDMQDLTQQYRAAALRASRFELPPQYQQAIDGMNRAYQQNQTMFTTSMHEIDTRLKSIDSATPAMQRFCDAVNRRDDRTVRSYLSPELLNQPGNIYETILGKGYNHITVDHVALASISQSLLLRAIISGPTGNKPVIMHLPDPVDGRWQISEIEWPKPHPKPEQK